MRPWFEKEQSITEFKEPVVYKGLEINVRKTNVKPPYIATVKSPATGKEVIQKGGNTEQEALDSAKQAVDKRESDAPKISAGGQTSVLLNTPSNDELLKDPSMYNNIYAKISKDRNGPTLVIGNELYGAADLEADGFVRSYDRRMKKNRDSEEALPQVMFNASNKFLSQVGIKMNGRYTLDTSGKYKDDNEHTVYPLQFQGSTVHAGDKLRMSRPALTIGATREDAQPWFEKEVVEGDVIKFPTPKAKVIQMPNVAGYPDFITGVLDLKAKLDKGEISQDSHDKLYTDLIHRFMKKESFENPWFIREGKGLRGRQEGTPYTDKDGTIYIFAKWQEYPKNSDRYPDAEQMNKALSVIQKEAADKKIEIRWANQPTGRSRAFGFGIFISEDKTKQLWLGTYYITNTAISSATIQDQDVLRLGLTRGTKKGKTASSAVKMKSDLDPGSFQLNTSKPISLQTVINNVSKGDTNKMLTNSLKNTTSGQPITFLDGKQMASALRDDFLEIITPVAVAYNHNVITGPLDNAIKDIFKGESLDGASFVWPVNQNSPLVDSQVISRSGIEMNISSKGKKGTLGGAKASITNIWKAKEESLKSNTGKAYAKKFPEAINILDICKKESSPRAPITLALKYKLISNAEATALLPLVEDIKARFNPASRLLNSSRAGLAPKEDYAKGPKILHNLFKQGGYRKGSYFQLIVLAVVAKKVVDYINNDGGINFGEAIRSFLNSSAMIQATSSIEVSNDDVVVKNINVVYPPNFKDKATMENNAYYGTDIKSKFSFSMPTK